MTKNIYLYCDDGADEFCLNSTEHYFGQHNVTRVMAKDVTDQGIPDHIDIFIMPGGADKPYARLLAGQGNKNIQRYVENGGTYLGLCAGGYYGCASIEFQKKHPNAICEPRELQFFKGIGVGCLTDIAPLYDKSLQCARITPLKTHEGKKTKAVYWGGCTFVDAGKSIDKNYEVIAYYDDIAQKPPAIIRCLYGRGCAILSGVHFEMTLSAFEKFYHLDKPKDESVLKVLKDNLAQPDKALMGNIIKDYL